MRHNKHRKLIVGVLGMAIGGLVTDKLFFGGEATGPSQAAAAEPDVAAPQPKEGSAGPSGRQNAATAVAARLEALRYSPERHALTEYSQNAFRMSQTWRAEVDPAPIAVSESGEPIVNFSDHKLSLVMRKEKNGRGVVVVDGRILQVGDELDGMTLKTVEQDAAVFEGNGRSVTLRLPEAALAAPRR